MKRVDALRSLMGSGIQRVDLMADFDGEPINIDAGMAIKLYNYLDEDLCDPKDEQQKPKAKRPIPKKAKPVSEDKADPPRRGKIIDAGKLLALARQGWKAPQIAEELNCSEATVYNYLKKCKEEGKL